MSRGGLKKKQGFIVDRTANKTCANSTGNGNGKKYKFKKDALPNLGKLSQKLSSKISAEKLRKEQISLKNLSAGTVAGTGLLGLAKSAASRSTVFNQATDTSAALNTSFEGAFNGDDALNGKKDNSRKAYYKEFKKVVQQADVILEVLDCRDPLGCRTREVEEMIMNAGSGKKIVLILNKIDLVPKETVEAWLKYLRNEFPTIAFKSSTQTQRTNLGQSQVSASLASDALLGGGVSIGSDSLVKLLKNYCRSLNLKTSITVGVVGFPNVGKSSVINSLKRAKVCGVGSTPGVTKVAQTIHLDKNINLLDCPGIVFSKPTGDGRHDSASVLLRNCVKVELLDDPVSPVEVILERCSKDIIKQVYGVTQDFENTLQFLVLYAQQRGKLLKGGVPDVNGAARCIIQDWNSGKIPFYTVPPQLGIDGGYHIGSSVVTTLGEEFNLDEAMTGLVGVEKLDDQFNSQILEKENAMDIDLDVETGENTLKTGAIVTEIKFKMPKTSLGSQAMSNAVSGIATQGVKAVLTSEEAVLNPQRGFELKKLAKREKKKKRKAKFIEIE